jgi:subfamily B ATP-binding cassette protein MsbA
MRVIKIQSLNVPLVQILAAITIGIVILIGTQMSARDLLSPGEFVAYITAMGMIFDPVRRLTGVNATIQRGLAAAESIYQIFDQTLDDQRGHSRSHEALPKASLAIDQVSFSYPNAESPALDSVSFEVRPGESVALVGPSGSGKSSLIALIAGFLDPNSGEIRINDERLSEWPLAKRRRQLSLVGQQVNLFDATVADNIRFGWPDASDDDVREAARQAHALEFIEALPDGFDTQIGPFGSRLSGGQRQRIAIARAFIKDAPILLLDEPTSALDHKSREEVLKGLENLKANRTTLIISHQPETLLSIDRTVSLRDGVITR